MAYDYQRIRTRLEKGVLYATIDAPPIGRLMKNTQRQLRWSTANPPANGPANAASMNVPEMYP